MALFFLISNFIWERGDLDDINLIITRKIDFLLKQALIKIDN